MNPIAKIYAELIKKNKKKIKDVPKSIKKEVKELLKEDETNEKVNIE